MKVVFKGPEDIRELAAADLAKAGVEDFKLTRFPKGKAVEVADEVGKVLIENVIFGDFREAKKKSEKNDDLLNEEDEPTSGSEATNTAKPVGGPNGSSTKTATK